MIYAGSVLKRAGFNVLLYGYRSRKFEIAAQSKILHDYLLKRGVGRSELFFLTHSLGSIVTRQFAADYHNSFNLRRAVMLGPPNTGSETAELISKLAPLKYFLGPALTQLCDLKVPYSTDKLEIGIIAGGTRSGRGYAPHLKGDNDGIVTVEETLLPGAKDHIIAPGLHSIMMYYPSILRQAIYFFEHGAFDRSGSELFFNRESS